MVENSKQIRVDNWGIFFLQRLQMFFSKTDYCDLTLQFEGNVQLKVHRLVMNACTEYFSFLEQSCPALEENTIMMPPDLQADVIVPIVNFMYTGMLEFHVSIYEKLYRASELMSITVLTKLLDAQKAPLSFKQPKKKAEATSTWNSQAKKVSSKASVTPELPATLPGRKLPVWKRKSVPTTPMQHPTSQMHYSEQRWTQDPLSIPDNTPKPTRFEWPEDDLPALNMMDTSFEEISYTSKPLLTQEEENRASTSFDDIRNNVSHSSKKSASKVTAGATINIKEVEDYVKEQKIRSDLSTFDEGDDDYEFGQKRKVDQNSAKMSPKRRKLNDKENKETTFSIKSNNGTDLDHTKIVSEILKKYPQLVKKNKNIRLKIMASGNKNVVEQKVISTVKSPRVKVQVDAKAKALKQKLKSDKSDLHEEGPWSCGKCAEAGVASPEFVLYYLYRKHMTDVHSEDFDARLCKYCGRRCGKHNLMMYHLYTKHGLKPPATYNFPKCDQCPFIALSAPRLSQHKLQHDANEMQCNDCKLAFTSKQTLTAHMQITGHGNKTGKSSYDCQYCTKKLQSAINLFSHIKNSHLKEGRRDGIVSLDEMDEVDEADEEIEDEEDEEEYIVPEMIPDMGIQKDKVKIISNVKVPARTESTNEAQQAVPLEPSSEAEALSNVASGIATSLGLVDIVVLDDNQQYILQQQESQEGQPEFILPELTASENPFRGQVITTQHSSVLQQSMLQSSGTGIGSTDELVMVLTDHDYQDEHDGATTDNSNIVVLYSHPVDGQQGQFITSQGNLLVNSQTGMLEIRNGALTTAANLNPDDTQIESIEMIQREIESHTELKQEPFYEEDRKVQESVAEPQVQPEEPQVENAAESKIQQEEENTENEEVVNDDQEDVKHEQDKQEEDLVLEMNSEENKEEVLPETSTENPEALEQESESKDTQDNVDGAPVISEEPMEIDEVEPATVDDKSTTEELAANEPETAEPPPLVPQQAEQNQETTPENLVVSDKQADEGVDVPPETVNNSGPSPTYDPPENINPSALDTLPEVSDKNETTEETHTPAEDVPEPMEVDGQVKEPQLDVQEKDVDVDDENTAGGEQTSKKTENEDGATPLLTDPQVPPEDVSESPPDYQLQSETSNSQFNDEDENSQSSQSQTNDNRSSINQTILDDWDDTDSQQSEKQRVAMKQAAENVNKLMDDWEEEDEDDKREAN